MGSYLKSAEDFKELKKYKVSSVLSIQSSEDYFGHGLSEHFVEMLCDCEGFSYKGCEITDMNK